MTKPEDEVIDELVARASAGDQAAFSEIVRKMMQRVFALTYRMTRERESALDLAQDTFVAAWEKLASYRGESRFSSWLLAIAANRSLNYLKARDRRQSLALEESVVEATSGETPETLMNRRALKERLAAFVRELPAQQRLVFELRFYQQMSFNEIAVATERALGTVKTNYREAIQKLRRAASTKGWER